MYSCKDITISEFFGDIVVSYKPLIVLLKYTISDSIAELIDKCIKSRFGGSSLPTTIKDWSWSHQLLQQSCCHGDVQ